MQYHRNAKTNIEQRKAIKESALSSRKLSGRYFASHVTIAKWKKVGHLEDKSSRPDIIHYAVPQEYWDLVKKVREKAKLPIDDLLLQLSEYVPSLKRGNLYRILRYYQLNRLSEAEKREIKKFKQYPPGYLHIDCFYLPKFNGKRMYCYLAIDRATRLIFLRIYPRKNKEAAADFLVQVLGFYPFRVHTILTDNGKEFTNIGQKGYGRIGKNPVLFEIICELAGIDYRKTKARHPWTNGMAERAVRTVKENTLKLETYESLESAIIGILHYQDIHNFRYRMKVLNYKTPYQITMEWFVKEPKLFIKHPNELLTIR
jgi:transposase-like protein